MMYGAYAKPTVTVVTFIILSVIGGAQSANIGTSLDCAENSLTVTYTTATNTFNPTEGRVYVDGYYDAPGCFKDSSPWNLIVSFGTCGVQTDQGFVVIFLHDKDYFLETIDSAQTFTCKASSYATTNHNVTAYAPAGEIIPIVGQEANVPGFDVTVSLTLKNTSSGEVITLASDPVVLGGNVTLELGVTPSGPVKIQAVRCWAAGVTTSNGADSWKYLDLISSSCPAVPFFGRLSQDANHTLNSTFPMFLMTPRHESNRTIGFFCTVRVCDVYSSDCGPVNCTGPGPSSNGTSWGRRRRRAAELGMDGSLDDDIVSIGSDDNDEPHPMGPHDVGKVALGYFMKVIDPNDDVQALEEFYDPSIQQQNEIAVIEDYPPYGTKYPDGNRAGEASMATSEDEICIENYVLIILTVFIGLVVIAFCWISVCFFAYARNRSSSSQPSSRADFEMCT